MMDAIKTACRKLETFHASLSDEQNTKFHTMGPPQNASSQVSKESGGQQRGEALALGSIMRNLNKRHRVAYWPETEVPRCPRSGRGRVESGLNSDIADVRRLTVAARQKVAGA
ncbi:MAG: hypothetical protein WBF03_07485 [Xanthobacteraceae bacterium]